MNVLPATLFALAAGCAGLIATSAWSAGQTLHAWTDAERASILSHGPWPQEAPPDPTNRLDGDPAAIAAGARLFADRRLSIDGSVACIDCHRPGDGFTDGRPRATALGEHLRNTQPVFDLAGQRWFGWDGGADSLWAAALRPLFSPVEMGATPEHVLSVLRGDERYAFLAEGGADADTAAANAGKAMAAWMAGLRSPRTAFDEYRDALADGDQQAMRAYPAEAVRGLRLFVGRGRCTLCHIGPRFTNDEFHDIGRPFFSPQGGVDAGRTVGIRRLHRDRFGLLGEHNDEPESGGDSRWKTRGLYLARHFFGAWKTPTLRGLVHTAPYTHDGSLATLRDVVDHYSDFDPTRLHSDGEAILRPLKLSEDERRDLVAFLRSLSSP